MNAVLLGGVVSGLALALTAALTPVVRSAAIRGGMVRGVQADRWHTRPTPAVGGIAIFLGFGLAVAVGLLLDPGTTAGYGDRPAQAVLPWSPWTGLVAAAALAFLVGVLDDLHTLRPQTKLLGQMVAASVLLLSGIGVWLTGSYPVDAAISLLWFVGITNALNLLDNMDGLATGIAAVAGAYLTLLFVLEGSTGLAILAMGFTAALLGFLAHNYPPARIFMGDSGSLFIGLFLAGLALAPAPGLSRSLAAVLAAPVLILGVPILDTTLVTLGRLLEGRPVSQGGKDHTSHRLVDLGMPEKRTVWLLWGLAAVGGAAGALLRQAERGTAVLVGGVLVALLTLVGAYLLAVRFQALEDRETDGLSAYRFLVRSQQQYPVFALLLDGVWLMLAYYAAYLIRWDAGELGAELPYFQRSVALWVGLKAAAFLAAGVYRSRWPGFGLFDGLRLVRANVLATLFALGAFLLIDRVGLSRGVVAIDFLISVMFTVGARLVFRVMEGTTQRWTETGDAAVVLASLSEVGHAARMAVHVREPRFRVVALAAPDGAVDVGRLGPYKLFGGPGGLERALSRTGAHTVVVGGPWGEGTPVRDALDRCLAHHGGVDLFEISTRVRAVDRVEAEP